VGPLQREGGREEGEGWGVMVLEQIVTHPFALLICLIGSIITIGMAIGQALQHICARFDRVHTVQFFSLISFFLKKLHTSVQFQGRFNLMHGSVHSGSKNARGAHREILFFAHSARSTLLGAANG
jgi:hypothetical protein